MMTIIQWILLLYDVDITNNAHIITAQGLIGSLVRALGR